MAQTQTQTQQIQTQSQGTETLRHPHSIGIQLQHKGMPHGLGLLTTVASLPPKYRSRYLNLKTRCEIPLDLTVKLPSPLPSSDVPMATTFTEVYSENVPESAEEKVVEQEQEHQQEAAELTPKSDPTPPQSPEPEQAIKRKLSCEDDDEGQRAKMTKLESPREIIEATPAKPIKALDSAPRTSKASASSSKSSRNKATRKLKFDEETSSPVSGTIIRPLEDITDGSQQYSNGDIDPKYNIVEITEETKAELAAIKNVIGDYVCRLCKIKFEDAFGLARHRCACIVLLEYRCPECGKQFNCPANLASHRRWHKPRKEAATGGTTSSKKENRNTINQVEQQQEATKKGAEDMAFDCGECGKKFKRAAYLRKHQLTHQKKPSGKPEEKPLEMLPPSNATTTTITGSFHFNQAGASSSSASSSHSDEGVYAARSTYEYDNDYLSDSSSSASSVGYGRLQIVEHGLTEEESIAAAALTNLRNCASVIQHTTMAH